MALTTRFVWQIKSKINVCQNTGVIMEQFSRTESLLGADKMHRIADAHIAVFGIGGVGGYAVEALARCGVNTFDLFDDDLVCVTNINRQIIATVKTIGKYKVDVMKERIMDINPAADVTVHRCFFMPENSGEFDFKKYTYIVDAIDTVTAKIELVMKAKSAGVPIISCMGAGNKLDPTKFEIADIYKTSVCPLAKVMRKELRTRGIDSLKVVYSKETPIVPVSDCKAACAFHCVCPPETDRKCTDRRSVPGSISFSPAAAGLILASAVINDIISDQPE